MQRRETAGSRKNHSGCPQGGPGEGGDVYVLMWLEMGWGPLGQPFVIIPSSTSIQRQNEVAKLPLSTKKPSSGAKQSQERDRARRRSKRSRSSCTTTSHRINYRPSDRHLDFATVQALDPSRSGIERYANNFLPDDVSNYTFSRNTDHSSFSDRFRSVFRTGQSGHPESSDHVDKRTASENKSDWKSTTYATTKLAINLVKESSDVFPPLKSVAGGLTAILDHCEVCLIYHNLCRPRYLQPS